MTPNRNVFVEPAFRDGITASAGHAETVGHASGGRLEDGAPDLPGAGAGAGFGLPQAEVLPNQFFAGRHIPSRSETRSARLRYSNPGRSRSNANCERLRSRRRVEAPSPGVSDEAAWSVEGRRPASGWRENSQPCRNISHDRALGCPHGAASRPGAAFCGRPSRTGQTVPSTTNSRRRGAPLAKASVTASATSPGSETRRPSTPNPRATDT